MRAPVDSIAAPSFPRDLEWVNVATLRMEQQKGRPVLVEFWDFCRVNSLRTLPYVKEWHARYAGAGLRVIGVHSPGFPPSVDPDAVRAAVARLDIAYAVAIDSKLDVWRTYENAGWPARYLFDQRGMLYEYHYGEGGYAETERAIQALLGIEREPIASRRPEEAPGAALVPQTPDQPGAYRGPYEAGGVWLVLDGAGTVRSGDRTIAVDHPGCYEVVSHPAHTSAVLDLEISDGVTCHATCFTPGLAA